jgi:hypothetical protein
VLIEQAFFTWCSPLKKVTSCDTDLLKPDPAEMTAPSPASLQIDSTPAEVFLSYSSADRDRVKPLVELLEQARWRVWWDRKLRAGSPFQKEIEQALELAGCVLVVWSKNSVVSDWVIAEADEGRKRQILIPVALDQVAPPLQFRTRHTVDLSNWSGGMTAEVVEIFFALKTLLGSPSKLPKRPSAEVMPVAPVPPPPEPAAAAQAMSPDQWLWWSARFQLLMHVVAVIAVFIDRDYPLATGMILTVAGMTTSFFAAQARRVVWRNTALWIGVFGMLIGPVSFFFAAKRSIGLTGTTLALGASLSLGLLLPEMLKKQSGGS